MTVAGGRHPYRSPRTTQAIAHPRTGVVIAVGDTEVEAWQVAVGKHGEWVRATYVCEPVAVDDVSGRLAEVPGHAPRYQYDCGRCKFSWCCGPTCSCVLKRVGWRYEPYPDPPRERQDDVDAALVAAGYAPQFRGTGAQRR